MAVDQEFAAGRTFHLAGPPLEPQDGRLHNLLKHCQDEPEFTGTSKSFTAKVLLWRLVARKTREPVSKNAARRGSGGVPHRRGYRTTDPACKFSCAALILKERAEAGLPKDQRAGIT